MKMQNTNKKTNNRDLYTSNKTNNRDLYSLVQ